MRRTSLALALAFLGLSSACASSDEGEGWEEWAGDAEPDDGKADGASVKLRYKSYDVLFTNPLCQEYGYDEPVPTADGSGERTGKPRNVYCAKTDFAASAERPTSPQHRLVEWLRATGEGDEIFAASLSFSNTAVAAELCAAAERGASVTVVLDGAGALSEEVEACGGRVLLRGHAGSIGYAHNKLILINPKGPGPADADPAFQRLAFGSGNLSSGLVLHHENWHFVEVARETYFARAHACLMDAQLSDEATAGKTAYRTFLNDCRAAIPHAPESDISTYFIPSLDDSRKLTERMVANVRRYTSSVDIGVHRFGHADLVDALATRLANDDDYEVRMVADDDLYWLDPAAGSSAKVGLNDYFEADNVEELAHAGGSRFEIRYLETNHGEHLLHHNKYLLFRNSHGRATSLLAGAANLTSTGFKDNFENVYWIRIPHVLRQFEGQMKRVWDGERLDGDDQDPPVATPVGQMPAWDARP